MNRYQPEAFELEHKPGYGHHDHLAGEVIARVAAGLGLSGAASRVAAERGFLSHGVPLAPMTVRVRTSETTRAALEKAVERAKSAVLGGRHVSTRIDVVRTRTHHHLAGVAPYFFAEATWATEVRRKEGWALESTNAVDLDEVTA